MNNMKFTDVMLDIETAGRVPGCAIIEISAVPFNINTGEISKNTFKMSINLNKQLYKGFSQSKETINWWKKTNNKLFNKLSNSDNHYVEVGKLFQSWFKSLYQYKKIRLWGNSPRFDISILMGWYAQSIGREFTPFWNTWEERDVRTLASLAPNIKSGMKFVGTKHNSLDDCKHQIKYCHKIVKTLKLKIH